MKKFTLLIMALLLVCVGAFIACQKTDKSKDEGRLKAGLTQYTTAQLTDSLYSEIGRVIHENFDAEVYEYEITSSSLDIDYTDRQLYTLNLSWNHGDGDPLTYTKTVYFMKGQAENGDACPGCNIVVYCKVFCGTCEECYGIGSMVNGFLIITCDWTCNQPPSCWTPCMPYYVAVTWNNE